MIAQHASMVLAVGTLLTLPGQARSAPPPGSGELLRPGWVEVKGVRGANAAGEEPGLRLRSHHSRLERIVEALNDLADPKLRLDSRLRYKRVHVFSAGLTLDQLKAALAQHTRARWTALPGEEVLSPPDTLADEVRRLRRGDPLRPERLSSEQRLHFANQFIRAASSPEVMRELERTHPRLAQQVRDPVVQFTVRGLRSLRSDQKLAMTGRRGLWVFSGEMGPAFQAELLTRLREHHPNARGINRIGLALGTDGALKIAIDMQMDQGNSITMKSIDGSPAQPARAPAELRPADELPPEPLVEPATFLVRDPRGALPYKFYESLRNLAEKYSLNVLSDIQFQPPKSPGLTAAPRAAYLSLLKPSLPIGECLEALAAIFGFRYEYADGVHFLRNLRWYWEEACVYSDEDIARVEGIPRQERSRLGVLKELLHLQPPSAEALSVIYGEVAILASAREEIELYAALREEQRDLLRRQSWVSHRSLNPDQQKLFWKLVDVDLVPEAFPGDGLALEYVRSATEERLMQGMRPLSQVPN